MKGLTKTPIEYYKMFYNDTAIHGNTPALMLAYHFWGAGHLVLGADMPLGDHYHGFRSYRQTINAIEAMDITEGEKRQIFAENALRLLRLPARTKTVRPLCAIVVAHWLRIGGRGT